MTSSKEIADSTRCWVKRIVIGHDFCPFARVPFEAGRVHIGVSRATTFEPALEDLIDECLRLDNDAGIETTLLVYPDFATDFDDFLDLIELANRLLAMQGYEGIYQLAHFHPDYVFDGSEENDAANYTNRSPHPTLHIIREASLARAVAAHPDTGKIPQRNIRHAREVGGDHFATILAKCRKRR